MNAHLPTTVLPESWAKDVQLINVRSITIDETDPQKRTFSLEVAEHLAESIQANGLLCPVIIHKFCGSYMLIAGRHRLHACAEILRWEQIPCLVLVDPDEQLVESIELSTNLSINPLNREQRGRALRRLFELHKQRYPSSPESGRKRHGEGFASVIEKLLGVSEAHAQRLATTASRIDSVARTKLEAAGVSPSKIDEVAALKEPDAIQTAVDFAAAGQDVDEAIRVGKKVKAEKKAKTPRGNTSKASESTAPMAPKTPDLTDDEWLETHCGKIMGALPFKNAFRQDASCTAECSRRLPLSVAPPRSPWLSSRSQQATDCSSATSTASRTPLIRCTG